MWAHSTDRERGRPIIVVDSTEKSYVDLLAEMKRLPWPMTSAADNGSMRSAIESNVRNGCIAMVPFDGDSLDACKLCARYTEGSAYLIFVVTNNRPETVSRAFEAGADDVLTLPVTQSELRARLAHGWQFLALKQQSERLESNGALMAEMSTVAVLHSKNYFENELAKELARSRRFGHPLAVLLAETSLSDEAAEGTLRACGHQLRELVRKEIDWVARCGPIDFAVVFPETGLEAACTAARRILRAFGPSDQRPLRVPEGTQWYFGVAALSETMANQLDDPTPLIAAAEEYLRAAKRKGPNRIAGGYPSLASAPID